VLERSLSWSFEASLALLTYMTFVGAYLALRRGAHLKVDVIVRRFPLRGQAVLFVVNQLMIAGTALVMLIWGGEQTIKFAARTTTVMELPLGFLYVVVPLAGLGMLVDAIVTTKKGVERVRRGEPPESDTDPFTID
jgi:TRAP-type C4-dicarboxylate transport system permease small subunit